MSIKDQIRAEIERYKQGAAIARFDNAGENADYFQGKVDLCDDLLGILDTIPEQPVDGLEEFDKECHRYFNSMTPEQFLNTPNTVIARHFAEWGAGQEWIDDGSMPPETKQESDTLQGHREWTESEPVLAWDSMYGCCVDWTRNGKWMSEQKGGYTGQVCHGIVAWRPIPEYKGKQ